MSRSAATYFLALLSFIVSAAIASGEEPIAVKPLDLFEQRIMPIFRSPQPASCTQCHLAGVSLKDYILPSHEQTFVSLRDQGLIDLADPKKSKILTLIDKGREDPDDAARLIHEKMRQAEYEAFEAWIIACCDDPKLRDLPQLVTAKHAKPKTAAEVIQHSRRGRVVDSFVRNIWSQRMRCFPCHTPYELDSSDPKHRVAIQRHKDFMEQDGKAFAGRMILFKETPEATLQYLVDKSRKPVVGELPLINLQDPPNSLIVLKPTSKLPKQLGQEGRERPSNAEPVSHMGGLKMHVDDQSYKSFLAWIQDYARVVQGNYTSVDDLPADDWFPSRHVIIVNEAPDAWPGGARVQLFIHAWNVQSEGYEPKPLAFTQGSLTPRRTVTGTLFLIGADTPGRGKAADASDTETARLAPGKYLLKAYIDRQDRLSDDPTVLLGPADFFGQTEMQAKWGQGFPEAERVSGKLLK